MTTASLYIIHVYIHISMYVYAHVQTFFKQCWSVALRAGWWRCSFSAVNALMSLSINRTVMDDFSG